MSGWDENELFIVLRPEAQPEPNPECFLDDVLSWRPPLPAGELDVFTHTSSEESEEATEPGYAWERLPGWIAEVQGVYDNVGKKPIVGVDVCSSVPVYAQTLRAHEFARSGARGNELMRALFSSETFAQLESTTLLPITSALSKDKSSRELLAAAIQEVLYTVTEEETRRDNDKPNPELMSRLEDKLTNQSVIYEKFHVSSDLHFRTTESDTTYFDRLVSQQIPSLAALSARARLSEGNGREDDMLLAKSTESAGSEQAQKLIKWQARYLADHISGNRRFRPARYFSMDIADPVQIASSSMVNSPQPSQEIDLFKHAINSLGNTKQHIRGSIFNKLPFPDNSLALITCFDAWPFHFQLDEEQHTQHEDFGKIALDVLVGFYNKLAPGGKIVIFPWAVHSDSHSERKAADRVLDAVAVEFSRLIKHGVNRQILHRETLESWMSIADKETLDKMSPVFNDGVDHLEALMVVKPKESSLKNREHINTIGGNIVSTVQAQGSQDPRQ